MSERLKQTDEPREEGLLPGETREMLIKEICLMIAKLDGRKLHIVHRFIKRMLE